MQTLCAAWLSNSFLKVAQLYSGQQVRLMLKIATDCQQHVNNNKQPAGVKGQEVVACSVYWGDVV